MKLIVPTMEYDRQIQDFRREYLESGESIPAQGIESGTIIVTNQKIPTSSMIRMRKRHETTPNNVYLGGAKFRLYTSLVDAENGTDPISKNTSTIITNLLSSTFDTDDVTMISRSSDGEFFKGMLENGTYYLKEVEAPSGYSLSNDIYEIKVNASDENGRQVWYRKYDSI